MKLPLLAIALAVPAFGQQPDGENPAVFLAHKEKPRATSMPFPTKESAAGKDSMESPWCLLLNGNWKFRFATIPSARPAGFEKPEFDDTTWKDIPVPSDGLRERSDEAGCYRHQFTLPEGFENRRTRIVFEAAEPALSLWINGREIGRSEDPQTPAEFDITDALQAGDNLLAVGIDPSGTGGSGIIRDVYLWSSAPVALEDFWINCGLADDQMTGTLDFTAKITNKGPEDTSASVTLTLTSPAGAVTRMPPLLEKIPAGREAEQHMKFPSMPGVKAWSAEAPNLYQYEISLADASGKEIAAHSGKIGFRRDEIEDGRFLHNGELVRVKEAAREDQYPGNAGIRADLLKMKARGINTVRTSRYSNDPALLNLCDELGFYAVAEAKATVSSEADLERVKNLLERDKNHPCIIMWSPGDSPGNEGNSAECSEWLRQRDPFRPIP